VRAGRAPDAGPRSELRSEAALFLAADLTLLRAAAGGGDYESAATAYEHALREAPDFADAARAWFLLGQAELAPGFTPGAGPGFPLDYAEALALAGDVDGARRVLAHAGHMPRAADDEARLRLLAGRLAADAAGARAEYEQALAQRPAPALAVEAKMRLALLEAERTPERTVQALADLAATPAPHALRAVVLGEAAEVAASAGR